MGGGGSGGGAGFGAGVGGQPMPVETYQWAYSIMDSSRVSTFFISILLIVYGSFRSVALEEDKQDKSKYYIVISITNY